MLRLLICSVGTSLLSGAKIPRPWKWNRNNPLDLPDPSLVDNWLNQADPIKASAETNTLSRLDIGPTDRIVLMHSDTPDGEFCAQRLFTHYQDKCRGVELRRISELGYGASSFTRGLKSLIDVTSQLIRDARMSNLGESIVICATGGFKAEIAFLNVLGALLQVEVVYIHEHHEELVTFPSLPLAWDMDFVSRNKRFFEWIEDEGIPRRSIEVESWLNQDPMLRNLVEDGGDGCTYLSPAGLLLYQAAKDQMAIGKPVKWPEPSPIPPEKKQKFQNREHERPRGWERYVVDRLCEIGCVALVGYCEDLHRGERVRILDAAKGVIGVRYEGPKGESLPIRVETTARGEEQTRLVADYIRRIR